MSKEDMTPKELYVPRITQIDSKYLDNEVHILLKETLSNAFKHSGQNFYVKFEPELEVALKLFLYYYTIGKRRQSVGQELLQITYQKDISSLKVKYYCLSLVLWPWLKQRLGLFSSFVKNEKLWSLFIRTCDISETFYQGCDVLNLMFFLVEGRYPSLLERFFGLRVSSTSENGMRRISYAYFMRELLWNGFAEMLATVLPFIPTQKFHAFVCQFLPSQTHSPGLKEAENESVTSNVETICTICNELAILPNKFGCNHVACFYCIHSAMSVSAYICSVCGTRVHHASQISPVIVHKK